MTTKRQRRIAEQIHLILSEVFQFEVSDPRLEGVTIMDVKIDRELQYVNIYVSALGGEAVRDQVMEGLQSAAGFLRRRVGEEMRTRHTPELRFHWDETLEQAEHIHHLIDSLDLPPSEEPHDPENANDAAAPNG